MRLLDQSALVAIVVFACALGIFLLSLKSRGENRRGIERRREMDVEVAKEVQQEIPREGVNLDNRKTLPLRSLLTNAFDNSDVEATLFLDQSQSESNSDLRMLVGACSIKGEFHHQHGIPRQDSFSIFRFKDDWNVVALGDGLSSASRSHLGSRAVTLNLPKSMEHNFDISDFEDRQRWVKVNQSLSKALVRMNGGAREIDGDSRLAAAKQFATTLEILVISRICDVQNQYPFYFIRVAGDGSLFLRLKDGSITALDPGYGPTGPISEVHALPVCDDIPKVYKGILQPGEILLLATDGIGDYLARDAEVKRHFSLGLQKPLSTISSLIDLCSFTSSEADDDRSLAILQLVE